MFFTLICIDNTQAYRYYMLIFDNLTFYWTFDYAVLSPEGEPVYDEEGNPVTEKVERPKIMQLSEFTLYGYDE